MKADPAVQRRLLDLAEIDAELGRIEHRRRSLPELAEVTEVEKTLRRKRDGVVAVQTALADLDSDIGRQEKDIDAVRAREDRDRKLLDSGLGAKQQTDVEHELNTLQRRQSALEDDLLELMERREAVQADTEHAKVALAEQEQRLADASSRRDQALLDLDTAQARAEDSRQAMIPEFPAELLALYQQLLQRKGAGAALLRARKCGACRLELDRTAIARIATTPADEVIRCDECGVILVRTAESGL